MYILYRYYYRDIYMRNNARDADHGAQPPQTSLRPSLAITPLRLYTSALWWGVVASLHSLVYTARMCPQPLWRRSGKYYIAKSDSPFVRGKTVSSRSNRVLLPFQHVSPCILKHIHNTFIHTNIYVKILKYNIDIFMLTYWIYILYIKMC